MSKSVRARISLKFNVDPLSTLVDEKDPNVEVVIHEDGKKPGEELVSPATLLQLTYLMAGIMESHVNMIAQATGGSVEAGVALQALVTSGPGVLERARERADEGKIDLEIIEDYVQKTGGLPPLEQPNIVIAPDGSVANIPPPEDPEMGYTLKQLQSYVGGMIEVVQFPNEEKRIAIVNEEGLLQNMPYNNAASQLVGQDMVGPVIILREDQLK